MSVQPRRIQVSDLGEAALKLVHEMQESGEEVVLADGDRDVAAMRPADNHRSIGTPEEREAWREQAAEYWERIDRVAARITKNWTSELSAVEALEEQRQ